MMEKGEMGNRIKKLRQEKGYTQEQLGSKIGIQKAAIQKYESGAVVNLKTSMIFKLAEALETSPIYILGLEEYANKEPEEIFYLDSGDRFMSKYPPEAQAELEIFLNYLDHKYGINK